MRILSKLLGKHSSGRYHQFRIRVDKKSSIGDDEFSGWWLIEDEVSFEESKAYKSIDVMYESCRSHEAYIYPDLLSHLGIIKGTPPNRLDLPEEDTIYLLKGPNRGKIILSISREKGIRFLFPFKTTTPEYTDSILQFISREKITAAFIFENHMAISKEKNSDRYEWFKAIKASMKQENGEDISMQYFNRKEFLDALRRGFRRSCHSREIEDS